MDGTPNGTQSLGDLWPGTPSGSGSGVTARVGNAAYFPAWTGSGGLQIWRTDGTPRGTSRLTSYSDPNRLIGNSLIGIGDRLFYGTVRGVNQNQLWVTDGTVAGTSLLTTLPIPCCYYEGFRQSAVVGGRLYFGFGQFDRTSNLYVSDGTSSGTRQLSFTGGLGPADIEDLGGIAIFSGWDSSTGREVWRSNGTSGGTRRVANVHPTQNSDPRGFTAIGSMVFFSADNGSSGRELWKTDGTAAGTGLVKDIRPGAPGSLPTELIAMGGRTLLFG